MFSSLPVQDTGNKNTELVNPNVYLVHDSNVTLHLEIKEKKSCTH